MRVLVAARESLVALTLRDELESAGHVVIGPVSSSGEALLLCNAMQPQCAIVDAHLEREEVGTDLARRLCERHDVRVVLTSDCTPSQTVGTLQILSRSRGDLRSVVRSLSGTTI
jgi:two-component system, response regulator PdtaR